MSSPSYETKVRPAGWWYAIVAALWIASAIVFVVLFIRPLVGVLDTDLTAFANGDPVSVGSDGLSVYVEDGGVVGRCVLTGDGGVSVTMKTLDMSSDFKVDTTGPTLTPHASTPDSLPAGTYEIRCAGGDSTVLATGKRIDEDSLYTTIGIGFVISLILGLAGLVLLIVLLIRRHNSKNRIRTAQAAAYYGGWPQQQGYDPYGQQQQQQPPAYDPYAQQQQQTYDPYNQQQGYGQQQPPPGYPPAPDQGYGTQQGYQAPQQPDYYGQQPPASTEPYGGYEAPAPDAPVVEPEPTGDQGSTAHDSPDGGSTSADQGSTEGGPTDNGSTDSGSTDSDNR